MLDFTAKKKVKHGRVVQLGLRNKVHCPHIVRYFRVSEKLLCCRSFSKPKEVSVLVRCLKQEAPAAYKCCEVSLFFTYCYFLFACCSSSLLLHWSVIFKTIYSRVSETQTHSRVFINTL